MACSPERMAAGSARKKTIGALPGVIAARMVRRGIPIQSFYFQSFTIKKA
jgi:hypothetical protein